MDRGAMARALMVKRIPSPFIENGTDPISLTSVGSEAGLTWAIMPKHDIATSAPPQSDP
jgi:hypothetical protein